MSWRILACLALLATIGSGCEDIEQCGVPGETQACTCTDGRSGAQECLPETVWGGCVCTGPFFDGSTGGDGDVAGDGDATPAGDGDTIPAGDGDAMGDGDDAGVAGDGDTGGGDGDGDTGSGGDGDTGGGGDGDTGGGDGDTGGGDGDVTPPVDAYATCAMDSDCPVAGSLCVKGTSVSLMAVDVCSPPCQELDDCQVPAGDYDAEVGCVSGRCVLDCMPAPLEITGRSCPAGMQCATVAFSWSCYAN